MNEGLCELSTNMRRHTEEAKAKMSAAKMGENNPNYGKAPSEETKAKQSAAMTGRTLTKEHKMDLRKSWTLERRTKMSIINMGKTHTEETKAKISAAQTERMKDPRNRAKIGAANTARVISEETRTKLSASITGENNPAKQPETRVKMSTSAIERFKDPENHPRWQGGISFEPYCPRFNYQLKEQIRNRDNRTCVLCGKGEIQNGKRLAVHHIDADKMQGCNHAKWYLCALCNSCNSKPDTVEKEFLIVTNGGISV